ncbi:hypothetical protein PP653_gp062 [Bacillus phage Basilisk]|uniref:Uncharacterized protein n=1 Tax=Bacillus phage Basilisk TaxID=1296654 RepID=S5MLX2_9CAUD|nr:hypothetical protein PP653_gp062 [Bacillus phage Basilisk]AGR46645.1 hypothetical protein BASILISK_105 [Bacillus phage Basilisk]
MDGRVALFKAARREREASYKRFLEIMDIMINNNLFHDEKLIEELDDAIHTCLVMKSLMKTCRKKVDKDVISYRFR